MQFSCRFRVRIRVRNRFSVCLVSGYAHVLLLLCVVIVTLPLDGGCGGRISTRRYFEGRSSPQLACNVIVDTGGGGAARR